MDLSDYEFMKKLNEGHYGFIHLVRKKGNKEEFVIKRQKINEYNLAINEVSIMKKLNHPNITVCYKYWIKEDESYILMEYVSGYSLFQLAKKFAMKENEALDFFAQLALGVDHMHQRNIIHRDLKPENILLAGPRKIVKIVDFGLSKDISSKFELFPMSPDNYGAPEIWSGEPHTFKSDIWSIGALLYEVVLCEEPEELRNDLKELEKLPKPIKSICQNVLKIEPDERPESHEVLHFSELRSALLNYYQNLESPGQEIVRLQIQDIINFGCKKEERINELETHIASDES